MIAVSIVSHRHGAMVARLLARLLDCPDVAQVIVTRNVPEPLELPHDARIWVLDNQQPKGFGANHNAAFAHCKAPLFCVLNPDIQLPDDPFPTLLACSEQSGAALVVPRITALDGTDEDNVRRFPTLTGLLRKALTGERGVQRTAQPDWVAGMFMLWRSEVFGRLCGFDEGYFLYYEDVDLCVRARRAGFCISYCSDTMIIHEARRSSRHDLRFMRWHAASLVRYFWKHWLRLPKSS